MRPRARRSGFSCHPVAAAGRSRRPGRRRRGPGPSWTGLRRLFAIAAPAARKTRGLLRDPSTAGIMIDAAASGRGAGSARPNMARSWRSAGAYDTGVRIGPAAEIAGPLPRCLVRRNLGPAMAARMRSRSAGLRQGWDRRRAPLQRLHEVGHAGERCRRRFRQGPVGVGRQHEQRNPRATRLPNRPPACAGRRTIRIGLQVGVSSRITAVSGPRGSWASRPPAPARGRPPPPGRDPCRDDRDGGWRRTPLHPKPRRPTTQRPVNHRLDRGADAGLNH